MTHETIEFSAAVLIAALGGLVRGVTGFGGSLVMAPPLSLLFEPAQVVVTALVLEVVPATYLVPAALRKMDWRVVGPICLASFATIPLGTHFLVSIDPMIARRVIAAIVGLFSLVLLIGLRYAGRQRLSTSLALGGVAGVLVGATSIGAPPVILYLLSGPDPAAKTRANLIFYVTAISVVSLVFLWLNGVMTRPVLWQAALLAPVFFAGMWVGNALFKRVSEQAFRRTTLAILVVVSVVILVA